MAQRLGHLSMVSVGLGGEVELCARARGGGACSVKCWGCVVTRSALQLECHCCRAAAIAGPLLALLALTLLLSAALVLHRAGLKAFFTTPQLEPLDKVANSLALGTSPIVRALFDPEGGMQVREGQVGSRQA